MRSYGWMGLIGEIKADKEKIIETMIYNLGKLGITVEAGEILVWGDCLDFLSTYLPEIYNKVYICLEYILPKMGGRRPDVILFLDKKILILEFKMKDHPKKGDIIQAIRYREDILKYHKETWKNGYEVEAHLVLTKCAGHYSAIHGLKILTKKDFSNFLNRLNVNPMPEVEIIKWIKSTFEPLPEVVRGAITLFETGELPNIKNIKEGDLIQTENLLKSLIRDRAGKKRIILTTGVPGAGKTILALKTVYDNNKKEIETVYLSGNLPFISILQGEIKAGKKIIGVIDYIKEYYNKKNVAPEEVIVFDENQRAWDGNKVNADKCNKVKALLEIGNRIFYEKNSATIIVMMNSDQEINEDDKREIELWAEELKNPQYEGWEVHAPIQLGKYFTGLKTIYFANELSIETSIRSNFTDIRGFKEAFLKPDLTTLKEKVELLYTKGYELYWTDSIKEVEKYLNSKEQVNSCILGSSGIEIFAYKKIFSKDMNAFLDDKSAHHWYKNRGRDTVATESIIQGLDIDYPVLVFGGDYHLFQNRWTLGIGRGIENKRKSFKDVNKHMKDIYSVLLTSGRKGMLLFLPEGVKELRELKRFVKESGIEEYKF